MIRHLAILALALALDLLLGSSRGRLMPEKGINRLHKLLSKRLSVGVAVALSLVLPCALALALCAVFAHISSGLGIIFQAVLCWQLMGVRELCMRGAGALQRSIASGASQGEDALRSVLEQNIEGFPHRVFAPVLCVLIGGAPLAVLYFSAHVLGGRTAYFADWLPSKVGAFLLCACAPMSGLDGGNAFRIFMRDGDEPGASCMAAVAGAMHLQLRAYVSPG